MKYFLLSLLLCFLIAKSLAQPTKRNINFRSFEGGRVIFPLNQGYYLIEDSGAEIIRYGHFNFNQKKFFGKFKDVSMADTNLIVAEGAYNGDGFKDGEL